LKNLKEKYGRKIKMKKQKWMKEDENDFYCQICKEDSRGRVSYYHDGKPVCINCDIKINGLLEED